MASIPQASWEAIVEVIEGAFTPLASWEAVEVASTPQASWEAIEVAVGAA